MSPRRTEQIANDSNLYAPSSEVEFPKVSRRAPLLGTPNLLRRSIILLLSSSLILGAGIAIGKRQGSSVVDTAIDQMIDNGAIDIERSILERAAIEGALKATGDQWANYFPKSALDVFNERQASVFTGIGISLEKTRSGVIEISGVEGKSPAAEAGLRAGDQLLEVNGTRVQGASLTSVIALIRGEVGKRFDILVERGDSQVLATLTRTQLSLKNVEVTQIAPRVAYLQISSFGSGTATLVRNALATVNGKDGVIIDLRDNPGGLLQEAVSVAEIFIGNGVIVSYRVNAREKIFTAANPAPNSAPLVLLINRSTASAAEILAGAIQDRNRGVVIGEGSYGKGSVQEFVTLDDGSKLELTVALYLTPSGRTIEGEGITPDLRVNSDELGLKALQILGGLASLNQSKGANIKKSEKN